MPLNGVITLILLYFTEFDSVGANHIKVVENSPRNCVWWRT